MSGSWEPFGSTRRSAEERVAPRRKPAPPPEPAGAPPPASSRLRREPSRKLVVITCMDARIDPLAVLGLSLGEANVIRNAGATVSEDVLRSVHASQTVLGTRRAVLLGHTDCAGHPSDAAAAAALADGVRRLRGSASLPDSFGLEALMYDVATGEVRPLA